MNNKTFTLLTVGIIVLLAATLFASLSSETGANSAALTVASPDQKDYFAPTVWKPTWVDQNNN